MTRRPTVPCRHRALVSQVFAVLLVTLIVSPFTAPFALCSFEELTGDTPLHQGAAADKTAKEHSVVGPLAAIVVPVAAGVVIDAGVQPGPSILRLGHPIVLRL